jgi:hypothetical protein
VAHQLGVPVAGALVLTSPLAVFTPLLGLPALIALLFVAILGCFDAVRAAPPSRLRIRRLRFRAVVAALCLAQPVVRAWGRMSTTSTARRDLGPPAALLGPARAARGVVLLPIDGPRELVSATVVDVVRRAGLTAIGPTGWENWDARLLGSLLVAGVLVTSGHVEGTIQIRVQRRLRMVGITAASALVVLAAVIQPALGVAAAAVAVADIVLGMWRTGPVVRRAIVQAAGGMR